MNWIVTNFINKNYIDYKLSLLFGDDFRENRRSNR